MRAAYGLPRGPWWQPFGDGAILWCAAAIVLGAWGWCSGGPAVLPLAVGLTLAPALIARRPDLALVTVVLLSLGAWRGADGWESAAPRALGPYRGWATLMSDPAPSGFGVRAVLAIDGERFETIVYGGARSRLVSRQGGDRLEVEGERTKSLGPWARRNQVRHVVGEFVLHQIGAHDPGRPLDRASNRLRSLLRRGAERTMSADRAALFTGLVIGDDVRQPSAMVDEFRTAGLSHLTAVSGQNVAFVLAVAGLGVRRLRPLGRWLGTLATIGWFVVITRVEPSVVRAGMMAALAATAFALGRDRGPVRMLGLAVLVLVMVDPMLVWSVSFWLSTGATLGVSALSGPVERLLGAPRWLMVPLSVSIAAQIGVALPSWLVFHRLPVLGLVANLLAVPIAGLVMLYGLPIGLLAGLVPPLAPVVMMPASLATAWVAMVAAAISHAEPHGVAALLTAFAQGVGIAVWVMVQRHWRRPPAPVGG